MSTNTLLLQSRRRSLALEHPVLRIAALIFVIQLAGCAAGPDIGAPSSRARIPAEAPYLLSPLTGFPLTLGPSEVALLEAGHRELVQSGATATARDAMQQLLQRNPELDPAVVLGAQADLVDGTYSRVLALLGPVIARHPDYDAAQLLYARAAEHLEQFPEALVSYATIAERSQLASSRLALVGPLGVEVLARRVSEALEVGHLDAARSNLALLEKWAPREIDTFLAAIGVASAQGDRGAELTAFRQLAAITAMDDASTLRRARLELEVGDAGSGLRIIQDLVAKAPEDSRLAAELARAKFLWRLELLPEKVRELSREPEISRGDLAAMLYWLFPSVRYGQAETGRIANDVLNHRHRQEIVRVANLGIMSIDPRLHRFEPNRVLSRAGTMVPILRILGRQRPLPACLSGYNVARAMSNDLACTLAVRCGLVDAQEECLPRVPASGNAAIEWTRRALDNLGAE